MAKIKQLVLIFFIAAIAPNALAYQEHEPILVENIHATAESPHIIEGYEISNPNGDCIKVINSEHVIIRNNYLHDCGSGAEFMEDADHYSGGYAALIGDSFDITFENNRLDNNFRGFMAYNSPRLKATKNTIKNTIQYSPLWCERCSNSEFAFNFLSDNGNPEEFWGGHRSIGIWIKRSDNVDIHDNEVVRSTSDGISVTGVIWGPSFTVPPIPDWHGPQMNWDGFSQNCRVYNNLILDNMEQGVWLLHARGIKVFNNTIRTGCFTYGSPVSTEFNVGDSEIYSNKLLGCLVEGVGGWNSFNIHVHDNTYYSNEEKKGGFAYYPEEDAPAGISGDAKRQGVEFQKPHSNKEDSNKWVLIEGALAEEMQSKLEYAEEQKTYHSRGWWLCLREDNSIDEECQKREDAKGSSGVPPDMLLYSSLMADFDEFAAEEENEDVVDGPEKVYEEPEDGQEELAQEQDEAEDRNGDSIIDELKESWEATLIVSLIFIIAAFLFYKKRAK